MPASEAVYFHNAHFAHIVAYENAERVKRIAAKAREFIRSASR